MTLEIICHFLTLFFTYWISLHQFFTLVRYISSLSVFSCHLAHAVTLTSYCSHFSLNQATATTRHFSLPLFITVWHPLHQIVSPCKADFFDLLSMFLSLWSMSYSHFSSLTSSFNATLVTTHHFFLPLLSPLNFHITTLFPLLRDLFTLLSVFLRHLIYAVNFNLFSSLFHSMQHWEQVVNFFYPYSSDFAHLFTRYSFFLGGSPPFIDKLSCHSICAPKSTFYQSFHWT